jgi:radical SAM superfamily enzyme YgiQ (UPF0313 family)
MTHLLLTHGYFLLEDKKEQEIMKPYPPLGLLYLSAFLRREGVDVEVHDATFSTPEALAQRLGESPTGILGIYTNLITRSSVLRIVRRAKACGWSVVLGGPESANYPEEYLRRGADVVVLGEGELTLRELVEVLPRTGPHRLHEVTGTVFLDESGAVVQTAPREQIRDLDTLPWPDREAIDVQAYVDVWRTHHGSGSVNLITARGCPYKCRWCSHAVFGFTHRRRSYIDCADELEHVVDRYDPDQVWYADDVFTIHHRWLRNYADELKRRGLRVPFETISRADRMMKEEVLETLADMGCWRIWIGSESGSQRVLDAMNRGVTVEQVQSATRMAQRHGIQVGMFLMWGYEGETADDIAATVEHVKKTNPDIFFTTVAYPIKNTPYFDEVSDRLSLTKAWEEASDRDYEVEGRMPREYYGQADIWLKSAVAAHKMKESEDRSRERLEEITAAEARASEAQARVQTWGRPQT